MNSLIVGICSSRCSSLIGVYRRVLVIILSILFWCFVVYKGFVVMHHVGAPYISVGLTIVLYRFVLVKMLILLFLFING